MTEPSHLHETRASYDTVAVDYAELVRPAFEGDLLGRAMLGAFAELVRAAGGGPVADVGCGPGHVTAHLHSLGLPAFGVELSPGMVEVARRDHPGLRFDVGTMTALELADGELDGVVAWYSIIHTPPEVLPTVFEEFHRVLAPGGHLLLGFHVGDERRRKEEGYGGHAMTLDVYLLPPDRIAELAIRAGLVVHATLVRGLESGRAPGACLLVRKPRNS
ncbi:class I SAM-dependent methyltransferase [Streptomyces sp. NBC_00841]|uniref:class I SAM-dependent DNA methyltransferase n=1 Tax=unclassified Streptomyces TaxID=2593676 RepID=UPI00225AC4FD|nr:MULTISPECIES: class I SAM-dependent methyltransferase [unclassified Streptomyces]MCX4532406.1 class I SAM-dependent methyltransferase [Streptomyces sp. NBC_01669]WSA02101.1 class I SAM-dependent methyltransferase [Streptomyces sp. NBC_00841]